MAASSIQPARAGDPASRTSDIRDGTGAVHDAQLDSAHLLHGQREVLIRHGSELYRLRHTRNDKLILTK